MGGIKTYLPIGLIAFLTLTNPAIVKSDIVNPLYHFASCAGRLSAQMEHEWLLAKNEPSMTEHHREAMLDLLQATMRDGDGRQVLAWRIDAKAAHASLLTRATFKGDSWAAQRAIQMVQACTSIMMS